MVGRITVTNYCDPHWFRDGKEEAAEYSTTLTIKNKTYEMEWCEACNNEQRSIEDTLQMFVSYGRKPDTTEEKPSSSRLHKDPTKRAGSLICPTCGARYTKQNYYEAHLELHKDNPDLPYKCPECDRAWGTAQSLGFHRWRQHGVRGVHRREN